MGGIDFRPKFTRADIAKAIKQNFRDKMMVLFVRMLMVVGEKSVNYARSINTYKDQTGNLRSSIGYAIYHDGKKIFGNFKQVKQGGKGVSEGEKLADKKAAKRGFSLVITAGMNYAAAVQVRGLDVLDGAELVAQKEMDKAFTNLVSQIDKWAA